MSDKMTTVRTAYGSIMERDWLSRDDAIAAAKRYWEFQCRQAEENLLDIDNGDVTVEQHYGIVVRTKVREI